MIKTLLAAIGIYVFSFASLASVAYVPAPPQAPEVISYGDTVKVVGGFYRGCEGLVKEEIIENVTYLVDLHCRGEYVGSKLVDRKCFVLERLYTR